MEVLLYVLVGAALMIGLIRLLLWAAKEDRKDPKHPERIRKKGERERIAKTFNALVEDLRKDKDA